MSADQCVGIVGGGFGLRVILPCLRAAGFRAVLCSRRAETIEAEARGSGADRVTSDYDSLLRDAAVDLVCVATEPALHAEMSVAALSAGKHLLCEKPLARTVREAQKIAGAAAGKTVISAVDHELRFHPNFERTRRAIADGEIGDVRHVSVRYSSAARLDRSIPWSWWADSSAGGGQLNALGSHMVDAVRWWLVDEAAVATGQLATFTRERPLGDKSLPVTSDEYASFVLQFSRGAMASVTVSAVDPADSGIHVEIVGETATLTMRGFDMLSIRTGSGPERDIAVRDPLLGRPVIGLNSWRTSLVRHGEHLRECMRSGSRYTGATLVDGVETQRVLDAVRTGFASSISAMRLA